jgi:hypothetical protein
LSSNLECFSWIPFVLSANTVVTFLVRLRGLNALSGHFAVDFWASTSHCCHPVLKVAIFYQVKESSSFWGNFAWTESHITRQRWFLMWLYF